MAIRVKDCTVPVSVAIRVKDCTVPVSVAIRVKDCTVPVSVAIIVKDYSPCFSGDKSEGLQSLFQWL